MGLTAAHRSQAASRTRRIAPFAAACALLAAGKLWLVAGDEVVATNNPLDQLRYLEMARDLLSGAWLGDYDHHTLVREPVYPLWLVLVHEVGLPLRLATEGLLVVAAFAFAVALRAGTLAPGIAIACFALLVLEPHSLVVNREVLRAGLYLPLLLFALSALLAALCAAPARRRTALAALAGALLGALACTRPETPLAVLPLAVAVVWGVAVCRRARGAWRPVLRASLAPIAAALIALVATASIVPAANRAAYGVWLTSELSSPGFVAALRVLGGIEHAAPRRYVPVPADARALAYAASPALRPLAPFLETGNWARNVSCRSVRVCDDYAAGQLLWILRESASRCAIPKRCVRRS